MEGHNTWCANRPGSTLIIPVADIAQHTIAGLCFLVQNGYCITDDVNRERILGASGDPNVPALGFRYDTDERWSIPNPTGLPGVFEGYCPPHFPDMRAAVEALARRKFGPGGPFHADTTGAWKESGRVRGSAEVHTD